METTPAGSNLFDGAVHRCRDLGRRGSTTKLDEQAVRRVPQLDVGWLHLDGGYGPVPGSRTVTPFLLMRIRAVVPLLASFDSTNQFAQSAVAVTV